MTRRIAIVKIAHELLPDLLHLPIGTKVVGVECDQKNADIINITVTHGHLKEVADGADVPVTNPVFTSERDIRCTGGACKAKNPRSRNRHCSRRPQRQP